MPRIKRYAKGAQGHWDDDLAIDINLRRTSFVVSFMVGHPDQALQLGNIIHDVNVSVSLDADLRNIADGGGSSFPNLRIKEIP